MSAEFDKMISDLQTERINVHLLHLAMKQTPVGFFFGFEFFPSEAAKKVHELRKMGLNVACVIVIADRVADALKNFDGVPAVSLESIELHGEESFSVKPHEVFFDDDVIDLAFAPYFARHGMEPRCIVGQTQDFLDCMKHLPELYAVHESFIDDESRKVFRAAIKGHLTGRIGDFRFAPEAQYFLDGFLPTAGDIAIDGGAYDGATAKSFTNLGAKVFAFEMDAKNYRNCLARVGQSPNITIENLGLSDKESEEIYWSAGAGSQKNSFGDMLGKFIDLDTYVARKNIPHVDYIKLDIEGAELDMLHGAAKTITRSKPKMAISAYHKWADMWTLAPYIKSLRPDYEFAFRHYQIDCTDYALDDEERAILKYFGLEPWIPSACEMVLYCR